MLLSNLKLKSGKDGYEYSDEEGTATEIEVGGDDVFE